MIKSNTPPPAAITRRYIAPLVRVLVLAAFLVTAVQSSADAARQLAIVNESGQTVTKLYAVASYYGGWGDSWGSIPNRNIFTVSFSNDVRYVKVKAQFSNGTYKYWDSLDLNNVGWIKVTPYGS